MCNTNIRSCFYTEGGGEGTRRERGGERLIRITEDGLSIQLIDPPRLSLCLHFAPCKWRDARREKRKDHRRRQNEKNTTDDCTFLSLVAVCVLGKEKME